MFKIGNAQLGVKQAEIVAWINREESDTEIYWSLKVISNQPPEEVLDGREVKLEIEDFDFKGRFWKDLLGYDFCWEEEYNEPKDCPYGRSYHYTHEIVPKGHFEVLKRDQNRFLVRYKGLTDINWDESFDENVPFEIECWAEFVGISMPTSESESLQDLINLINSKVEPKDYIFEDKRIMKQAAFIRAIPKVEVDKGLMANQGKY